ncbi:MAG: hypothetical protein QOF76_426 [Solirubrobacteraceae bacterium]|jgi:hypothetical protein|nr:hypothetical protein [Solirubrobacteraceae bacterium]
MPTLRVVLICVVWACAAAGPAQARIPQHICRGEVHARGEAWGFQGTGVGCHFMRRWTGAFLQHGREPSGWRCLDLGDSGHCRRHHHTTFFEFYAMD